MPVPAFDIFNVTNSTNADDRHWYAVYTRSRHEKRAAQQIQSQLLDCFLPLYRVTRHWDHRKAAFDLPLFPGYLFVHMNRNDRVKVLTSPGVLYLVGNNGTPTVIEESQIEALRTVLSRRKATPAEYLTPGNRVLFSEGIFAGLEGTVIHNKGEIRVVVSVDTIMSSIAIEVDCAEVELLRSGSTTSSVIPQSRRCSSARA